MEEHYTPAGIQALEKMARKGSDKASEALSKLINQHVTVTTLHIRSAKIDEVSDFIAQPTEQVVGITMDLGGDVGGEIILIYKLQSAYNVADFLAGRTLGSTKEFDALDQSAIKESANIIAGAFLAEISNYLQVNMIESPPNLQRDVLKAVVDNVIAAFKKRSIAEFAEAIAMEIKFSMESAASAKGAAAIDPNIQTSGHFLLLLDVASADKINISLKDISGGEQMTQAG